MSEEPQYTVADLKESDVDVFKFHLNALYNRWNNTYDHLIANDHFIENSKQNRMNRSIGARAQESILRALVTDGEAAKYLRAEYVTAKELDRRLAALG